MAATLAIVGGPDEVTSGANEGGKRVSSLGPDGYVFELHEIPPGQPRVAT